MRNIIFYQAPEDNSPSIIANASVNFSINKEGMGFRQKLFKSIEKALESKRFRDRKDLAVQANIDPATFYRYLKSNGEGNFSLESAAKIIDFLGGDLAIPEDHPIDTTRDVCWVQSRTINVEDGPPPKHEDYLAVPLAAEAVAAGPGLIPSDAIKGWVLVWRHEEAIRFKSNLVAVEIGPHEHSMEPTLYPKDIVLVDRSDLDPTPAGKIMLVCEPGVPGAPGGAMIKRVSTEKDDGDLDLVFYSDNSKNYRPFIYKLNRDYGGDITRAISGHVIWAWANMTKR